MPCMCMYGACFGLALQNFTLPVRGAILLRKILHFEKMSIKLKLEANSDNDCDTLYDPGPSLRPSCICWPFGLTNKIRDNVFFNDDNFK